MRALKGLLLDDDYTFTLESLALVRSLQRRMERENAEKEEEWNRTHRGAPTPTTSKGEENAARVSMSGGGGGGGGGGEKVQTCMLQFVGGASAESKRVKREE